MAVDDIWQITLIGRSQGQTTENVLTYKLTTDGDASAIRSGIFTWATATFTATAINAQTRKFRWVKVRVQKIYPPPVTLAVESPIETDGALLTDGMPGEVAAVLTKQTLLAGPRYRGRVYFPGLPTDAIDQDTGLFTLAYRLLLQDLADLLDDTIPATGGPGLLTPVIYHRVGHTTTQIEDCIARDTPRVQRRRQIARGI